MKVDDLFHVADSPLGQNFTMLLNMKWWQLRSIFSTEEQVPYCLISILSENFKADVIKYMEHYFQWSEKEKKCLYTSVRVCNRGSDCTCCRVRYPL